MGAKYWPGSRFPYFSRCRKTYCRSCSPRPSIPLWVIPPTQVTENHNQFPTVTITATNVLVYGAWHRVLHWNSLWARVEQTESIMMFGYISPYVNTQNRELQHTVTEKNNGMIKCLISTIIMSCFHFHCMSSCRKTSLARLRNYMENLNWKGISACCVTDLVTVL